MNVDFVPVNLPSKCLTYPGVEPSSVGIRQFRGREEQLVAELGLGNPKKKLLELMKSILRGVDPLILTTGDVSYILVWEAINSYSNMYPVSLVCQSCLKTIQVKIDLGEIDSKELPDDFEQPHEVEISNTKVKLRLLTLQDDVETFNFAEKGQSTYLYSYALSIVDEDIDVMARVKILESMDTHDLVKIRGFHDKFAHGPDFDVEYDCPKCGEKGRVLLPFRLDEFISASSIS
jgi:hypothetical protein